MVASPHIFNADESNFQTAVVERSFEKPVVVDFWAPWCGPCRALTPILEKAINARNGDVLLAKVNTDESPELAAYFQIEGIPAVKAISKGQIVLQFEGVLPAEQVEAFLDEISPNAKAKAGQKAATKLEQSDPAKAEAEYRKLIEKSPDDLDARLGLARVLFTSNRFDEIDSVLEPIAPGGAQGAEADRIRALRDLKRLAQVSRDEGLLRSTAAANLEDAGVRYELGTALAAKERFEEALRELLSAAEIDRELGRGKVRELMVKIFHIIGVRSDLADEYRSKLQRVLY